MKALVLLLCLVAEQVFAQAFSFRDTPFLINTFTAAAGGGNDPVFDNLSHYWSMDEASGTRSDSKGAWNMTEDAGAVSSGTGIDGNAIAFTDLSTKSLSTSTAFDLIGQAYTFNFWVKVTTPFSLENRDILIKHDTTGDALITLFNGVPGYGFRGTFDGGDDVLAGSFADNTWAMATITSDAAGFVRLYLNGSEIDSGSGNESNGNGVITIGNCGLYSAFGGLIDEIGFWPIELTAGNVTTLWNGGTGKFYRP